MTASTPIQLNPALAIAMGLAGLVLLYIAFKVTKLVLKMLFILVALGALAGVAWWLYFTYGH